MTNKPKKSGHENDTPNMSFDEALQKILKSPPKHKKAKKKGAKKK